MFDLAPTQWDRVEHGWIIGPDGLVYRRRWSKIAPHVGAALVAAGIPLLLADSNRRRLIWCDGEVAITAWDQRRDNIQTWTPQPQSSPGQWTAGRWESPNKDPLIVLTDAQ
jgi:hypothetical protein